MIKDIIENTITVQEFIELSKNNPLKFINYCEVVILKNGKILYNNMASHTIALKKVFMEKFNIHNDYCFNQLTKDFCHGYLEFLMYHTGCVLVWYSFQKVYEGKLTIPQKKTLRMLQTANLIEYNLMELKYYNDKTFDNINWNIVDWYNFKEKTPYRVNIDCNVYIESIDEDSITISMKDNSDKIVNFVLPINHVTKLAEIKVN